MCVDLYFLLLGLLIIKHLIRSVFQLLNLCFSSARGRTGAVLCAAWSGRPQDQLDRALIQQLQERCQKQALQLQNLQAQLKKTCLCVDVFSITTQHFYHKVGSNTTLRL